MTCQIDLIKFFRYKFSLIKPNKPKTFLSFLKKKISCIHRVVLYYSLYLLTSLVSSTLYLPMSGLNNSFKYLNIANKKVFLLISLLIHRLLSFFSDSNFIVKHPSHVNKTHASSLLIFVVYIKMSKYFRKNLM